MQPGGRLTGQPGDWFTEEMVDAVTKALLNEGCGIGHSIHSWRCEHPDRYGACDCLEVTARGTLQAIAPMVTKLMAEQTDGLERLLQHQREHDQRTEGWDAGYRQGWADRAAAENEESA